MLRIFVRILLQLFNTKFTGTKFIVFVFSLVAFVCITHYYLLSTRNHKAKAEIENNLEISALGLESEIKNAPACGVKEPCPVNEVRYHIKSGLYDTVPASICFNDIHVVGDKMINGRGINVVVVDTNSLTIVGVQTFDTWTSDANLTKYFKDFVTDNHVILVASQDEASKGLSTEGRELFRSFGSTAINRLRFRDNWVMIGQKGLSSDKVIEKIVYRFSNKEYPELAEISGCLATTPKVVRQLLVKDRGIVKEANCGVTRDCGPDAFPARLSTGFENIEKPKICVRGTYLLELEMGRGFNIAVIDPKSLEVVKAKHFDTFESGDSGLEPFLVALNDGEIVLVVTHDEASTYLTTSVRKLFEGLGSYYITNFTVNDGLIFAGQKGIDGRSTIEELEYGHMNGKYSIPIDRKLCIPKLFKGFNLDLEKIRARINHKRVQFCEKYVGFGDFCSEERNDEMLELVPLADSALVDHAVFSIPIVVILGGLKNVMAEQLEGLLSNPGIKPEMVIVFYDEKSPELKELIELFSFKPVSMTTSKPYQDVISGAYEFVWQKHSNAQYVITFEEYVIATKHYLNYLAQTIKALESDDTLVGISAWNENGYVGTSSLPDLVYRVQSFPGLGFLLKKSFYDSKMKGRMNHCCRNKCLFGTCSSWQGWMEGNLNELEIITPDTSFVKTYPSDDSLYRTDLSEHLFNRRRLHQINDEPRKLSNVDSIIKYNYEKDLEEKLSSSTALGIDLNLGCQDVGFELSNSQSKFFAVYYEQKDSKDETLLRRLCKCFKLFSLPGYKVRGKHQGLVRFSFAQKQMFLVGSATKYYRFKPWDHQPVMKS